MNTTKNRMISLLIKKSYMNLNGVWRKYIPVDKFLNRREVSSFMSIFVRNNSNSIEGTTINCDRNREPSSARLLPDA